METAYSLYDALVGINVPSDKARAVAQALERDMTATFVTKPDLEAARKDLRTEIDSFRREVRAEFTAVRSEMSAEFKAVRSEMSAEFKAVRSEMHSGFELVCKDMALQRSSLIIWLGSSQVVTAGLLFAALQFVSR